MPKLENIFMLWALTERVSGGQSTVLPERVTLKVIVDDVPSVDGVAPAHGLSVLIEALTGGERRRILFDTGPSSRILDFNLSALGESREVDVVIGSIHLYHHIGCMHEFKGRALVVAPPLPLKERGEPRIAEIPPLPGFYLVKASSYWGEQGLLIPTSRGYVLLVGCSVHGFRETFGWVFSSTLRIFGIVGGLGVSARDLFNLSFIRRVSASGVEFLFPLHSTSLEARRKIMRLNKFPVEYEVPGSGAEITI
jgi:7,8-dihydropterin-6-yl-methyl-4-(beta-D-ribofuranosyl)aminobenzene 5'-phosphate synthase